MERFKELKKIKRVPKKILLYFLFASVLSMIAISYSIFHAIKHKNRVLQRKEALIELKYTEVCKGPVRLLWRSEANATGYLKVTGDGNFIFLIPRSKGGVATCFDKHGKKVWQFEGGWYGPSIDCVSDNGEVIVLGRKQVDTGFNELVLLNRNGKLIWKFKPTRKETCIGSAKVSSNGKMAIIWVARRKSSRDLNLYHVNFIIYDTKRSVTEKTNWEPIFINGKRFRLTSRRENNNLQLLMKNHKGEVLWTKRYLGLLTLSKDHKLMTGTAIKFKGKPYRYPRETLWRVCFIETLTGRERWTQQRKFIGTPFFPSLGTYPQLRDKIALFHFEDGLHFFTHIYLFDVYGNLISHLQRKEPLHFYPVLSGNGRFIALYEHPKANSKPSKIHYLDYRGRRLWTYELPTTITRNIALSDNGRYMAAVGEDRYIYFFDCWGSNNPPKAKPGQKPLQ